MVLRYLWDRSHVYISDSNGTDPKSNFETTMDISEFEKSKKSHVSILGTYGTSPMSRLYASMGLVPLVPYDVMGPCGKNSRHGVPCVTLRKLWDRSHIVSKQTYGTGPICASENTIRPVPCMSPICDPQTPQWVVKIRMNEMAHSIPAGMKWPIPFRQE